VVDTLGDLKTVPRAVYLRFSFDPELHFAVDHQFPLRSVAVGGDIGQLVALEKYNLPRFTLQQPAGNTVKREIHLG